MACQESVAPKGAWEGALDQEKVEGWGAHTVTA